jgi:PGF-pre-PGF domain-containing protein/PGF-CTERM protein
MTQHSGQLRVSFLIAVMVLSVVTGVVGFTGSAGAAATGIVGYSADNVEIGQETVTQDVVFGVGIDGTSKVENVTLDLASADTEGSVVSVPDGTDDIAISGDDSKEVSDYVYDTFDSSQEINITLVDDTQDDTTHVVNVTATLTHNTSSVSSEVPGRSYTISQGGVSDTVSYDFVDTTAPTIENPSPTESATTTNAETAYTVDISDDGSGVDESTISVDVTDSDGTVLSGAGTGDSAISYSSGTLTIDGQTYAEGDVTVTVNADDDAGNSATQFQSTFTVDTEGPTIDNPTPADGTAVSDTGQTYTVDISDATSGVDESTISVDVTDSNGNVLTGASTGETDVSYSSGTLTIDSQTYAEGDVTVTVSADDNTGNSATQFDSSFTVDTTVPSVTGVTVTDAEDNIVNDSDDVEISATVTDSGSGVDTVTADASDLGAGTDVELTNGGDTYSTTIVASDTTINSEGTATISITADDTAGNEKNTESETIDIDGVAPNIQNFEITNDDPTSDSDIEVSFDSDENLDEITANVTGAEDGELTENEFTGSGEGTYTANYTANTDGDYTVKLEAANDTAGNNGADDESDTVTLDTSFPSISNVSLSNDGSGNLDLSFDSDTELGTADGDVSVSVDGPDTEDAYMFDNSSFDRSESDGLYTYTLDTAPAYDDGDGTYEVSIDDAIDPAGNNGGNDGGGSGLNDTYIYDTTDPSEITIDDPQEGDRVTSQNTITGTARDNIVVAGVNLTIQRDSDGNYWNGTNWQTTETNVSASADSGSFTDASESWSYDSSSIAADGDYNVTANVTDIRGNTNQSAVVNFTLYTSSPPSNDDGGGGGGGVVSQTTTPSTPEGTTVVSESTSTSRRVSGETTTVGFEESSPVESISFDSNNVEGETTVQTLSSTPENTGDPPGTTVTTTQITVPEDARDTSATIQTQVSAERLAEVDATADELQINRYNDADEEWQSLDTSVAEETESGVVLEAETPGFSIFTVSVAGEDTEETDTPESDTDSTAGETDTDTESSTDDGLPGFGVTVALAALVAIALFARRQRS